MKHAAEVPVQDKPTASVSFSMPKGCKVNMDMPMTVDETASVTINGKVTSISDDKYGKNFSMEPDSIKVRGASKKSTMGDEMRKMRSKHKYKAGDEDEDDG